MNRTWLALLVVLLAASACAAEPATPPADAKARARLRSSEGFSVLPPQGPEWGVAYKGKDVLYVRRTDPDQVSFFVGATDGRLAAKLASPEALLSHVRAKKSQWGGDGRYEVLRETYAADPQHPDCVDYDLSARDRGASNKGRHDYLVMDTRGRFCLHPQAPTSMIDVYYSVRYVPGYDAAALVAEGAAFLDSLEFLPR